MIEDALAAVIKNVLVAGSKLVIEMFAVVNNITLVAVAFVITVVLGPNLFEAAELSTSAANSLFVVVS